MSSPTSRTLDMLRKQGWLCASVEKFLPARGTMKFPRRIDVYGFGDLLACRERQYGAMTAETALVQCCTTGDMANRKAKILAEPRAGVWMRCGNLIMLVGWAKRGPRGKVKRWTPKIEIL